MPPHVPPSDGPSIEAVHSNVEWANKYRLELVKLVMTLATGVLAFTASFRPTLKQVNLAELMWIGWLSLGLSLVGGMIHMHGWDRFYISYRDFDFHPERDINGKQARVRINAWRKCGMFLQYFGFAIGVIAIALFAAINISNVTPSKN